MKNRSSQCGLLPNLLRDNADFMWKIVEAGIGIEIFKCINCCGGVHIRYIDQEDVTASCEKEIGKHETTFLLTPTLLRNNADVICQALEAGTRIKLLGFDDCNYLYIRYIDMDESEAFRHLKQHLLS